MQKIKSIINRTRNEILLAKLEIFEEFLKRKIISDYMHYYKFIKNKLTTGDSEKVKPCRLRYILTCNNLSSPLRPTPNGRFSNQISL